MIFLKDTSFDFFADKSDILIKNAETKISGMRFKRWKFIHYERKEINLKSEFLSEIEFE